MPRVAVKMTDKKLRTVTSETACGVVPGLYVRPRSRSDGSIVKYFVLRDRRTKRCFNLGSYPQLSLSEAFMMAADWRRMLDDGIDPSEVKKQKQSSLQGC